MKVAAFLSCLSLAVAACAGGSEVCRRDVVTGNEQCQPVSNDYGAAAATAGTATAAWGVVGCTVNNCQPPYKCNSDSKQCEPTHCLSDTDCSGFKCDSEHGTCR